MKSICDTEFTYQGNQPGPDGNAMFCYNLTRIGKLVLRNVKTTELKLFIVIFQLF